MTFRSRWAGSLLAALLLVACQSVRTQTGPEVSSDPAALATPGTPTPSPTAEATATPTPPPTAPQTPHPAKLTYNSVPGAGRTIAMTFDDGPHAKLTPQLLDILKARGIKATFFLVGQNAAEYPDIVKRIVAEGHELGNHSWSHPQLTKLGMAGARSQIERTNDAIQAAVGFKPKLMRPPYGATNRALDRALNEDYGMKVIMWSVDPLDWRYRNSARVEREILKQVGPGAIVLSHDIHATTVAAMPATLDALIARGYKFATVSELLAMENTQPPATPAAQAAPTAKPAGPTATPIPEAAPTATPFKVERYEVPSPAPAATPSEAATDGSAAR